MRLLFPTLFLALAVLAGNAAAAGAPVGLSHHGRLLTATDEPVDGVLNVRFSLYTQPSGGDAVWTELWEVTFVDGYYAVRLGDPADDGEPIDPTLLESRLYLGISVADGPELDPRQPLLAAAYALRARLADALATGGTLTDAVITGGRIDATELSVHGVPLFDENGAWVAPPGTVPFVEASDVLLATEDQVLDGTLTADRFISTELVGPPLEVLSDVLVENLNAHKVGGLTVDELVTSARAEASGSLNLARNGSFEKAEGGAAPDDWETVGGAVERVATGLYGAHGLAVPGDGVAARQTVLTLTDVAGLSGRPFTASAWVRRSSETATGRVCLGEGPSEVEITCATVPGGTSWQRVVVRHVLGSGAVGLTISLEAADAPGESAAFVFDGVMVTEGPLAPAFEPHVAEWIDGGTVGAGALEDGAVSTAALADGAVTSPKLAAGAVQASHLSSGAVKAGAIDDGAVGPDALADGAVSREKLAANAVDATRIENGAVVEAKLADGAVTAAKLGEHAVESFALAAEAVRPEHIEDGAVTEQKLAPGAVGMASIADGSITGVKIASEAVAEEHLAPNAVTAGKLAPLAVGTGALAEGAVGTSKLADDAVTTDKLAPNSVDSPHFRVGAVDESAIATGAVTATRIAGGAVGTNALADDAVTTPKLGPSAVTESRLATNAVTTAKLVDGAVTENKLGSGAVTSSKLDSDAVGTTHIVDQAVTQAKLGFEAVGTGQLENQAVTTEKLKLGAVLADRLADGAVITAKLASKAVTEAKIGTGAVTEEKLATDSVVSTKIKDGAVGSSEIADGAVGRTKIEHGAVESDHLASGAVTTQKIGDGQVITTKLGNESVTSAKLADGAVTSAKIVNKAVGTNQLADVSVTTGKLVDGSVNGDKIAGSSVGTNHLVDEAVTTAKIGASQVTATQLASNAVTNAKIQNGAVNASKLASNAVTSAKLASDANSLARVSGGALTMNGGALGIGTATPLARLHVYSNSNNVDEVLRIESRRFAGVEVRGDRANVSGEPGGAYLRFNVDTELTEGFVGLSQGSSKDPLGREYVGAANNGLIIAANNRVQIGALGSIGLTVADQAVGLGTASPATRLHLASADAEKDEVIRVDSNRYAGIQLRGDLANTSGEPGGAYVTFNVDGTAASRFIGTLQVTGTDPLGRPFTDAIANAILLGSQGGHHIQFGSSAKVNMTLLANGRLGIGTTAPAYPLDVVGAIRGSTWVTSDARLKNVEGDYERGLRELRRIDTRRFHYKPGNVLKLPSDEGHVGVIAQELMEVIPEAVKLGDDGIYVVSTDAVVWTLVNAVQEQQDEIEALRQENEAMRESFEARLRRLEALLGVGAE